MNLKTSPFDQFRVGLYLCCAFLSFLRQITSLTDFFYFFLPFPGLTSLTNLQNLNRLKQRSDNMTAHILNIEVKEAQKAITSFNFKRREFDQSIQEYNTFREQKRNEYN